MKIKDVRDVGVGLYRDGVMGGAVMLLPMAEYVALAREAEDMLTFERKEEPGPVPDSIAIRTVCGEIIVMSPAGCEQQVTLYRAAKSE